ncbi:HPr family phosphocarrier protein [Nocardia sp. NPDC052112]|uniref:HPr family phosphocarrier protein n=1 Tax=Nocardia sp. NPDC052112 TaxID=3155646 RepID=UPI00343B76A2
MASTTVTVAAAIGLHARPANIIAETVTDSGAEVTLSLVGGDPVDAGSALMIMTLGAAHGTDVVVTSDDPTALDLVAKLVATDLDA